MFSKYLKTLSILKKFLFINFVIFTIIGLFTLTYLTNIEPSLLKKKSKDHINIINNTTDNIKRLNIKFKQNDILLFGREDSGLPDSIIDKSDFLISIFMPNVQIGNNDQKGVRSLNLSVACGIAIYEAHKQINFQNGT